MYKTSLYHNPYIINTKDVHNPRDWTTMMTIIFSAIAVVAFYIQLRSDFQANYKRSISIHKVHCPQLSNFHALMDDVLALSLQR